MNYNLQKEEKKNSPITITNPAARTSAASGAPKSEAQKSSETKGFKNTNNNADFGVRSYLEKNLGVKSSDIDFDGQNVTLNGEKLITPEKVENGRSYVSGENDILKALGEYSSQNGIVAARDYVSSKGRGFDVSWNAGDGTVSVNGVSVKPSYIVNGKAYIKQSELDRILEGAGGTKLNNQILNDVGMRYNDDRENLYSQIVNDKGFSYNPKDDEAYQEFIRIYRQGVQDEFNNNLARSRFRTGGVASMGAMDNAAAIRKKALENEGAYLQDFKDRAYSEYQNSLNNKINVLNFIESLRQGDYSLESQAQNSDYDRTLKDRAYDMEKRSFERQLDDDNFERDLYRRFAYPLAENEFKLSELGVTAQDIANKTAQKQLNWYDLLNGADIYNTNYDGRLSALKTGVPYNLLGALGINDLGELMALFK